MDHAFLVGLYLFTWPRFWPLLPLSWLQLPLPTRSTPFDALLNRANERTYEQFLAQASLIHLEEIQLVQLAQQKSYMTDVKELGALLEKDHTQSLSDLNSLADRKGKGMAIFIMAFCSQ